MEKLIVVFATDDGVNFMDRHFGDAKWFDLYEIGPDKSLHIKRINNTVTEQDENHSSMQKAAGITGLFIKDGVQVLVSKKFGANINKIKTKFVCLLMNENDISESITVIQQNYIKIDEEWNKGKSRHFLNLKQ